MTNTTHYNLKKPEDNDNVLIGDLNENADAIDQALHGLEEGKAARQTGQGGQPGRPGRERQPDGQRPDAGGGRGRGHPGRGRQGARDAAAGDELRPRRER